MTDRYDHKEIEPRWQKEWEEARAFATSTEGEKFYMLEMFPYPSGKIHMGHVRNYSIGDVVARFLQMKGRNVLHPMGWDSFGLPAENAAIQQGVQPRKWTYDNIDFMRAQLKRMGFAYDWSREVSTSSPEYYRWNQWIFLKLLEKGLAYKKKSSVNWCPQCSTVLANEQVEEGRCWRCDSEVEAKELDQWFFRTTAYAEELLEGTYDLPGWPEKVLVMQRNWIGKSLGAEVDFPVEGSSDAIRIFTTRPDTLYGVTFMSLAPGHPLVSRLTTGERKAEVEAFVKKYSSTVRKDVEEVEKEGVFTGSWCVNPLTGDKVPVYVANFVLMEYGTGAVMAVPAHDQRDFEFARAYDIPVKVVINPPDNPLDPSEMDEAYTEEGVMVNSGPFDGKTNTEAMAGIVELLEEKGAGTGAVTYRLRDWGISRQRYWGCPIPVVYCDGCGAVPVPYEDLPVELPEEVDLGAGGLSPLESSKEFVDTTCPKCGSSARRETDTMDTFVDSSWYFLRYISPNDAERPFDPDGAGYWMPVDQYVGGVEHAVMHLLYARFFTKVLRDLGLASVDEPFKNLLTQGMVCKEIVKCPTDGFLYPEEAEEGKCAKCGSPVEYGATEKMSKSKKNVVDPDAIIEKYGADTTRMFSLFAAPPERDLEWSIEGVEGAYRFLGRVWRLVTENLDALDGVGAYDPSSHGELDGELKDVHQAVHRTIDKVTRDIEKRFHFNTAISAVMELVNLVNQNKPAEKASPGPEVMREAAEAVVKLLSPFAPHISEELWKRLGATDPLYRTPWPEVRASALEVEEVELVVQVNGKVRGKVRLPADADEHAAREAATGDDKITGWLEGKTIRKVIYVPGRILNIVVS